MDDRKNYPLPVRVLPLLTVLIAGVLISIAYDFSFSSNDDSLLRAIASGVYTGKPESHLIYIMFPLGCVFKGLYSILPSVEWYGIFMVGMHFLCWYLLVKRVVSCFEAIWERIFANVATLLLIVTVDLKYMLMHQYTVLAGVIVATAILWIATASIVSAHGEKSAKDGIVPLVLLIVSLWLRKEVLLMGLPLVCIAILVKGFKNIKKTLVYALIFAVVFAASFVTEKFAYSSREWKDFKAFNEARTEAYDYNKFPEYETYKDMYEKLEIPESEYTILTWGLDVSLAKHATTESLKSITGCYDDIIKDWQQYYSVPKKIIKDTVTGIFRNDVQPIGILMGVMIIIAIILSWVSKDYRLLIACLGAYAYRVVFTAYLIYKGRFLERVSYGLMLMILLVAVSVLAGFLSDRRISLKGRHVAVICAFVITAVATVLTLQKTLEASKKLSKDSEKIEILYDYCNSRPEDDFLVNTYSVATFTEKVFLKEKRPANYIVMGEWTAKSPLEEKRLERAGVTDYETAALTGENTYILTNSEIPLSRYNDYFKADVQNVSGKIFDSFEVSEGENFDVLDFSSGDE